MHEAIVNELRAINQRLDRQERLLQIIAREGVSIMTTQADIDAKASALNAKLTTEIDAEKAVRTLLGTVNQTVLDLKAQLAAANPTLDLSGFDAVAALVDTEAAAASAAAVVANTPVAPPAPAPAPVSPPATTP